MSNWEQQFVTDLTSPLAQSRESSLVNAQVWCNFLVFAPTSLPVWLQEKHTILRPECVPGRPNYFEATRTPWSPANSASVRTEYVTTDGTKFRVKQFLYDWARPACDHPCLWKSHVNPFPLRNGHVVWTGMSVLAGSLTDEQIVAFYETLAVVDENFARLIYQEPLSSLSYWARYRPDLIDVPVGLWYYHREDPKEKYEWSSAIDALPAGVAFFEFAKDTGFEFDSVGIFHSTQGLESEVIYTSRPDKSREVRAILQRGDLGRIQAKREPHPAYFEECQIGSLIVHLGYVSPEYGPFDSVIIDLESGVHALLMTSSAVGHTRDWFLDLLNNVRFTILQ
jgi:hypothetical protein